MTIIVLYLALASPLIFAEDLSDYFQAPETVESGELYTKAKKFIPGMAQLDPAREEFFVRAFFIERMAESFEQLPKVAPEELRSITPLWTDIKGGTNGGLYEAVFRGQRVLIKFSIHSDLFHPYFLLENRNLMLLNQLGLGPKYFGAVIFPAENFSGRHAIVMEKIDGEVLHWYNSHQISDAALVDFARQIFLLFQAGIYPMDFQAMLTSEGKVKIIDSGWFDVEGLLGNDGVRFLKTSKDDPAFTQLREKKIRQILVKDLRLRGSLNSEQIDKLNQFLDQFTKDQGLATPIGPFRNRPFDSWQRFIHSLRLRKIR